MNKDLRDSTRHAPGTDLVKSGHVQPPAPHSASGEYEMAIHAEPGRPHWKERRWGLIVSLGGVLILVGIAAWYWWSSKPAPLSFKAVPVDRGPITAVVTATGTVNPVVSVTVGSQVSGKISKLYADFNSVVRKGQVLAQIDPQPFEARVSQARAAVKSAKANVEKAKNTAEQRKRERDRMGRLRRERFVSQADLDLAETNFRDAQVNVDVMQAQLDQAEATLAAAELDLGYTTIYSPVNGIVVSRNVDVGQTVVASFQTPTLFVLAQDLTKMQVNANVSESDIGGVIEGKPANFRVDAYPKQFFEGTVSQVRNAPISIQNVVTYDVVITVDNRDLKLKPGMTANVTIVTDKSENPLRVPNGAVRFRMPDVAFDKKATRVWVLGREGKPFQVDVSVGIADSLYTEITEGALKEGDRVIIGIKSPDENEGKILPPGFGPRMR